MSRHQNFYFGSRPQRQRRREAATLTIQSWTRGMLSRRKTKQELRQQCDSVLAQAKSQGITEPAARKLIALLIRIYNAKDDSERLVSLLHRRHTVHFFHLFSSFYCCIFFASSYSSCLFSLSSSLYSSSFSFSPAPW